MQVKFEDNGAPLRRSKNRHGETCEEQLRRMVRDIADSITSGEEDAAKWMEDTYDIRYLLDSSRRFLGAEILVAGGGPTIWVDTFREQVTGWWGTDRVQWYYQDNMGLNDYMEEIYGY
tara:strand:- start:262 stop:615 length:354 start_codon:yes stop_codon:yes gene_type:complete